MFLNPWYGNGNNTFESHEQISEENQKSLASIQESLKPGWKVYISPEGRLYYCNHVNQTSSWLPPNDSWYSSSLPYGWELARDKEGKIYYINHINKTTTYEDPRRWDRISEHEPRTVELHRDSELGFGFVAGSEKPVIVRFVTSGGPSVNDLMPGDQILQINGEDVKLAPRDHVIQLVRNCNESVTLVVCQPPLDNNSARKSALLSVAKKAKLKNKPSRVRFAESVNINSHNTSSNELISQDSMVPLMPNVLKVFLENGQTKSFKYDCSTTVQDVIDSLQAKLCFNSSTYFSLVVEHLKSLRRNKYTLLDPRERLTTIASRPGAQNLRCLFRVTFVPLDIYTLFRRDPVVCEYLYVQSCNDVVQERFAPELKYNIALRLAALHIQQHVLSTSITLSGKMTIKGIEKDSGLERFVPQSLFDTMKRKELRKLLTHFLKQNSMNGDLSALEAKLHYLKIISELPSYGAKCFSTTMSNTNNETVILISPKFGISQIYTLKNSVPINLCDIEDIANVVVSKEDEFVKKIEIQLKDTLHKDSISLSLEDLDATELILVLKGYYTLLTEGSLNVLLEYKEDQTNYDWLHNEVPPYCSKHQVSMSQGWNYPPLPPLPSSFSSSSSSNSSKSEGEPKFATVDFAVHPPYHEPPDDFPIPSIYSDSSSDTSMVSNNNFNFEKSNISNRNSNSNTLQEKSLRNLCNSDEIAFNGTINGILKKTQSRLPNNKDYHQIMEENEEFTEAINSQTLKMYEISDSESSNSTRLPIKSRLKLSDSSFGLHSPDNIILDSKNEDVSSLKGQLLTELRERSIVLDPDMIDLTLFPPPMTPDEKYQHQPKILTNLVSSPPTPFADWHENKLMNDLSIEESCRLLNLKYSVASSQNTTSILNSESDIDSFIAHVTVAPPTEMTKAEREQDLKAFIIPPPPLSQHSKHNDVEEFFISNDVAPKIAQLQKQLVNLTSPERNNCSFQESPSRNNVQNKRNLFSTVPSSSQFLKQCSPTLSSSNDSISSSNSVNTIKSLTSPEESPPSLPPRNSPVKSPPKLNRELFPPTPPSTESDDSDKPQLPLKTSTPLNKHQHTRKLPPLPPPKSEVEMSKRIIVFRKAEELISQVVSNIEESHEMCGSHRRESSSEDYERARKTLTHEARQFVTASKLFVKSATESEHQLLECLHSCVQMIHRIGNVTRDVILTTPTPVTTKGLIWKIKDVVQTYLLTLRAAASLTTPKELNDPNMNLLMKRATALATVLTTLMRSLRAFN